MINVTKPFLPPINELNAYIEGIWQSGILTNSGPLHQHLESSLGEYLGCKNLSLYSNGTLALKAAIKILGLTGEVITTPFSFVATANVLIDCGLKPVFVDIDPDTFNLDPAKIRERITSQTSAIIPVHVYGTPCDVTSISTVANEYGLKVIYDAAHAFGVVAEGESILNFGDASALSFHSTKVFHTIEGGALALSSAAQKDASDQYKNFGFTGETSVDFFGINAKLNELQSAVGLLNLKHITKIFGSRKRIFEIYNQQLSNIAGLKLTRAARTSQNYSYFPILVEDDFTMSRDDLCDTLKKFGINVRRYFYPLIPDFAVYRSAGYSSSVTPIARQVSDRVICLPVFSGMTDAEAFTVVDAIKKVSNNAK